MLDTSRVASRLAAFGESVFTPIGRLAREHGALNLGQGFPDFEGPAEVRDAAIRALHDGHVQYAPSHGVPALQAAIARWTAGPDEAAIDPAAEVTVTCGATEALPAALLGLLEPGDEVIALEPFYDAYPAAAAMAGARFVTVPLEGATFALDPGRVAAAITPATRVLLVNTPHNPTGTVLDRATMQALADLCIRHDLVCITDEVYERLVFEGEHVRMRSLPGMAERTITISSLGKTFSFTGFKIGWTVAAPPLTAAVRAAHQYLTFSAAHPLQHAAAVALDLPASYHANFVASYRARRDRLVQGLRSVGFAVEPPAGAYFVVADHTRFGFEDDWAFCSHLIRDVGVAAIPASAFFRDPASGRHLVRFAFCKRLEAIDAALGRLRNGLQPT